MNKISILILMTLSTLLHGDYEVAYSMDTNNIKYTYKNSSTSKMINISEDTRKSVYVISNSIYLVSNTPSGFKIKSANNLKVKKRVYDTTAYVAKKTKPNYKIRKLKRKETVAGIEGNVWMVFGREGGQVYSQYVVVTNKPKVVKVMRGMFSSYSKMNGEILDLQNIFEIETGYMLIKTDNMRLESFKEVDLPPQVYALPKRKK